MTAKSKLSAIDVAREMYYWVRGQRRRSAIVSLEDDLFLQPNFTQPAPRVDVDRCTYRVHPRTMYDIRKEGQDSVTYLLDNHNIDIRLFGVLIVADMSVPECVLRLVAEDGVVVVTGRYS